MYSVNVDKLVKTSETQAESLLEITDNIIEDLEITKHLQCLAVRWIHLK